MSNNGKRLKLQDDETLRSYINALRQVELFSGLGEEELLKLLNNFPICSFKAQELLFKQGEFSDSMYILLSGHLIATLEGVDSNKRLIGKIKAGEVVGEMGFLAKKPRTLTISCATDSKLLKLSEGNFNNFMKMVPLVMRQILLNLIRRSHNSIQQIENKQKNKKDFFIFAVKAHQQTNITNFTELLEEYNTNSSLYVLSAEKLSSLIQKGLGAILDYLEELGHIYDSVVYIATDKASELNDTLLKQADILAVIANGESKPIYSPYVLSILKQEKLANFLGINIKKQLVLLWNKNSTIRDTSLWLADRYYQSHYHVKEEISAYHRLIRFWSGKPIGLVLGGGASRGWAHVGIIKALEEQKIPIDFIAGVSSGAGIASCYLTSSNNEEMIEMISDIVHSTKKSTSWRALTLPLISLYDSFVVTKTLQKIFEKRMIEDLTIPYYAVITNLSATKEVLRNSGLVWEALRCSASLPGIFPPVVKKGELLIDGGLMNNLPTDHMRNIYGSKAIIIASDLGILNESNTLYHFPPIISLKDAVLNIFTKRYKFPPLFDTFLKSMLTGSQEKYLKNQGLANYCIHSNLKDLNFFDFKKETADLLIEVGYRNTISALRHFKQ